jgi:polyisoprenoid-binding protein YceI
MVYAHNFNLINLKEFMMTKLIFSILLVLTISITAFAQDTQWEFDKAHTNIGFSISHLIISDVTGRFNDYDGTFTSTAADFSGSQVNIVIKTASIYTDNAKRDNHLRSKDFFDAQNKPEITFKSTSFEKIDDKKYKISGKLSMNGITKDVVLDGTFKGLIKDPWGGTRAGFKATTTLDRYDFDLTYNSALETGGFLIGKTVEIEINVELIKKS